jgi:hypothetical protein
MVKKLVSTAGCGGSECDWASSKHVMCVDGSGGCSIAYLHTAEESAFHDQKLIEATRKINRILGRIPEDPSGRKLSFCDTGEGVLLAWVKHGGARTRGAVTRRSSKAKIRRALKLTD